MMSGDWVRSRGCDTGGCLEVRTIADVVTLRESTTPDIEVVTTLASWQSWLDQARADERAAIVAWIRKQDAENWRIAEEGKQNWIPLGAQNIADLIECGEHQEAANG